MSVCVGAVVEVGAGEDVTTKVDVGVEKSGVSVAVFVGVENFVLVLVIVIVGVRVGTFGTQST